MDGVNFSYLVTFHLFLVHIVRPSYSNTVSVPSRSKRDFCYCGMLRNVECLLQAFRHNLSVPFSKVN